MVLSSDPESCCNVLQSRKLCICLIKHHAYFLKVTQENLLCVDNSYEWTIRRAERGTYSRYYTRIGEKDKNYLLEGNNVGI